MSMSLNSAVEYLRKALPKADRMMLTDKDLERVAAHALQMRTEMPWGKIVPDDIFLAFTLFPRVNNEEFVFYGEPLAQALLPRIKGLSMQEAILEINLWCYENATYASTDERTASALTVLTRTIGRCGEESVLLVCALRACGIPARQVYVPRWAHCDDNHAWVEVWCDGVWHYMGACEPEPVLDSGWFTAAASKAMLVHTRAYGLLPKNEIIAAEFSNGCILNRTVAYADTVWLSVCVTKDGHPCPNITVRFELANMAELYPIHEAKTDENGMVKLLTGYGTLHLHVHDTKCFIYCDVDLQKQNSVVIDFEKAISAQNGMEIFNQEAPTETRIQPSEIPEDFRLRLQKGEEMRNAQMALFDLTNAYTRKACLNSAVIADFLKSDAYAQEDKTALLDTLREKDFADIRLEVLTDALESALPVKEKYPKDIWQSCVLAPRIFNEMLRPHRAILRKCTGPYASSREVWNDLLNTVALCELDPKTLIPSFTSVIEKKCASSFVRGLTFVAVCRAHGMAARLNPVSGEPEYWENGVFIPMSAERKTDSVLRLVNTSDEELLYGVHYTIGVLENGVYRTLWLYGDALKNEKEIGVFAGDYRIVLCRRQIDGAVDGTLIPVHVSAGETQTVRVALRSNLTAEKCLNKVLPILEAQGEVCKLPQKEDAIIAVIAPSAEPTEHLLNELLDAKDILEKEDIAVRLLTMEGEGEDNEKLCMVLRTLKNVSLSSHPNRETLLTWRKLMHAGDLRLPFAISVSKEGKGLFAFVNYNVGSVLSLIETLRGTK